MRKKEKAQHQVRDSDETICHRLPNFIAKAARAGLARVFIGPESINPDSLIEARRIGRVGRRSRRYLRRQLPGTCQNQGLPDMLSSMPDEPQHWARVKEVLNLVLDAPPAERPRVAREACGGSAVLEHDVESLLAYSDQTGKLDDCLHETVSGLILSAGAPSRIGPYHIARVLGSGGMGTVYLVARRSEFVSMVGFSVGHRNISI